MKNEIKKFFERNFFNARWTCAVCGVEIFEGRYCKDCKKTLPLISGARCDHCGRKLKKAAEYCDSCKEKNISFDKARSAFDYEYPISSLIMKLKYEGAGYLSEIFAEDLAPIYFSEFTCADFISFVPMTEAHKKERGYNQAELIARALSEIVGVEVKQCAVKTKETLRQATLSGSERRENLSGAFRALKSEVKGKTVVIVDDVMTTGATADALSSALKNAGAEKTFVLTVASVSKYKR